MRRAFPALLAAVVVGLPAGTSGQQASSTALHVVSYVEVAPGAERAATGLLRQYRDASRRDHGSLRMDVLQQSGRPDHFVVLESWQDKDAWTAHGAAAHTKQFAAELPLQLVSPVDQRCSTAWPLPPARPDRRCHLRGDARRHDSRAVPVRRAMRSGLLKRLAESSRKGRRQPPIRRPGRATDGITSRLSKRGGISAPWTRTRRPCTPSSTREQLQPLAGSPLDERVFTVLK